MNTTYLFDRSDRGKLAFSGEQHMWFLHQLITADVEQLKPGQGAYSFLLTPTGKVVSDMRLMFAGRAAFLDTEPGYAASVKEVMEPKIFATQVTIAEITEDFAILTVLGSRADEIVAAGLESILEGDAGSRTLGASLPADEEYASAHLGGVVAVRIHRPAGGLDLWVRNDQREKLMGALTSEGARLSEPQVFDELRAESGTARFGVDFAPGSLIQEAAGESGVSFSKGCYLGQEAVAHTARGRVSRRIRRLKFEGRALKGPVLHKGSVTGEATTVGGSLALAMLQTATPLGAVVIVGDETAQVESLPGEVMVPKGPDMRELRAKLEGVPKPPPGARRLK